MNRKIINGVEHKRCSECLKWRPLSMFYKRNSIDGYRRECKKCFLRKGKTRYVRDRDKIQARNRKYYVAHEEEINKYKSDWQKENRERRRLRLNERYQTEPNFRIAVNLRTRILKALENNQKSGSTLELLGCSVDFFKVYLESLFSYGMSWENHGTVWHIDHKRPCASFDLSDPEQQKICFHYTNMQPLYWRDNLKKGQKYEQVFCSGDA